MATNYTNDTNDTFPNSTEDPYDSINDPDLAKTSEYLKNLQEAERQARIQKQKKESESKPQSSSYDADTVKS